MQVPLQPPPSLIVTAAAGAAAPEVTRSAAAQGGNFWRHTNRASVLNSQRAATQRAAGGGAVRGGREACWDRGGPSLPADRPPGPRSQSPPLAAMVTEASAVRVCGRFPRTPPSLHGWQLTGTWDRVAFGGLCISVNNTGHLALDFHKSPVIKVTRGSQSLSCPVTSVAARARRGQSSRMAPRSPGSVRREP